ncbi:MAG: hypothetical protein JWN98_1513, partial [Abditibacteriota bacterium]|nr:hypothetical protein [Abditibacteriota bacterium]
MATWLERTIDFPADAANGDWVIHLPNYLRIDRAFMKS